MKINERERSFLSVYDSLLNSEFLHEMFRKFCMEKYWRCWDESVFEMSAYVYESNLLMELWFKDFFSKLLWRVIILEAMTLFTLFKRFYFPVFSLWWNSWNQNIFLQLWSGVVLEQNVWQTSRNLLKQREWRLFYCYWDKVPRPTHFRNYLLFCSRFIPFILMTACSWLED